MRWNGYRLAIAGTITVFWVICGMPAAEAYASKNDETVYSLAKIGYTNDGGTTTLRINERKELEVTINTKTLENGYYTSFLYLQNKVDLGKEQVVSISISTKKALSMNVNLIGGEGDAYLCSEDSQVFIKKDGSDVYQAITVKDGTLLVPKGFQGQVYIPLEKVATVKELQKVTRLAFIFVEQEGQESAFTIRKLSILKEHHEVSTLMAQSFSIMGANEVQIPAKGEYVYRYELSSTANKEGLWKMQTEKAAKGITAKEDGTLTITDQAKAQVVELIFTNPDAVKFGYAVAVEPSWYAKQEEPSAINFMVPEEEEVARYKDSLDQNKRTEILDYSIRLILVLMMAGYLVFYSKNIRKR